MTLPLSSPVSPPPPHPLATFFTRGSRGWRIKQCSQSMTAKEKQTKKKKILCERQINGKKRRRQKKQSCVAGGGRRDEEMNVEMCKEICSSSKEQTMTHRYMQSALLVLQSSCWLLQCSIHTKTQELHLPTLFAETLYKKYDVMSAYSQVRVCVCVGCISSPVSSKQC